MPGKLWTAARLPLLGEERFDEAKDRPDLYGDTKTYWDYIYARADAAYEKPEASRLVSLAAASLDEGQLDELYDFYTPLSHPRSPLRDEKNGRALFHTLAARIRENPDDPEPLTNFTFFPFASGAHYEQIAEKIETLLGPEKTAALIEQIGRIRSPRDPGYGKPRTVSTCDAEIEAMRGRLSGMDEGRRAEMNDLLDRAALLTREATEEVAAYYNSMAREVDPFVQHHTSPAGFRAIEARIGKEAFDRLPTIGSGESIQLEISSNGTRPAYRALTAKADEYLGKRTALTPEYRSAVLQMLRGMDAMTDDYRRYDKGLITPSAYLPGAAELNGKKNVAFVYEQGAKYYGMYPAAGALLRLKDTLRAGDLDALKAAVENAEAKKKAVGELIAIAHDKFSPRGMFSANVNSTRNDVRHNVPAEFLSDYRGHNQVNSIYNLYTFCKNMDIPFEDMLDRPAEVVQKLTERYLGQNGVNSRKNPGAALFRLSNTDPKRPWYMAYDQMVNGMLVRGMEGLAGGEPDGKTSAELVGGLTLARAICSEQVGQEYELYQALIAATPEQQKALNRYIALQTGECDFLAAAKAFRDGDWAQKLAPPAEAPDYDALARRTEEILRGAEEERAACEALDENPAQYPWDADQYLRDAHEAYLRVLRDAPAEERNTPAFRRFRQSVMNMPKLVQSPDARAEMEREGRRADTLAYRGEDLAEMARAFGLPAGEALKTADVKTYPISGSAEYQKMARALLAAVKEQEQTGRYDPKHDKLIRDACVEYCLAKPTVRKTQSGRDRFNRALNLMMAVSLGDDPEVKDCFSRINAARGFTDITVQKDARARELDDYLTPGQFGFDLRHAQRETERVMRRRGDAGINGLAVFTTAMDSLDETVVDSRQSTVSEALSVVRTEKTRFSAKEFVDTLKTMHDATLAEHKAHAERSGEDAITALTARNAAARYMLAGQITVMLYGPDQPVDVARVAQLTNQTWKEYELDYRIPDAPVETPAQQKALLKDLNELGRTWLESQNIELARPEPVVRPEPEKNVAREGEKLTL